jgi:hypothetical protein
MSRAMIITMCCVIAALVLAVFLILEPGAPMRTTGLARHETVAHLVAPTPRAASAGHDAPHVPEAVRTDTSPAAWMRKFNASEDYLQFVKDALPAALKGDRRATWYIGVALSACASVVKRYQGSSDAEAQLNQELTDMRHAPQWARDLTEQQTHRCIGLAQQDPLASLPHRDGGYPPAYWRDRALQGGEPLAEDQAAIDALSSIAGVSNMSKDEKADELKTAQNSLRAVVESGDPDALYNAGVLIANAQYSDNPQNGLAVALAACDLGHDCSANNPDNVFSRCKLTGACPADADYAYYLQQSLGPEAYAQVYAQAMQIKQSIQSGQLDPVLAALQVSSRHL